MPAAGGDGGGDDVGAVAGADELEALAVGRVGLAVVLGQGDEATVVVGDGGEVGEPAAGLYLGDLAGITDEHELCLRGGGVVSEAGELAGVGHAGFVEDDHGPGEELRV